MSSGLLLRMVQALYALGLDAVRCAASVALTKSWQLQD
jgi:hypothetical protein